MTAVATAAPTVLVIDDEGRLVDDVSLFAVATAEGDQKMAELVGDDPEEPDPEALDKDLERTIGWWRRWCRRLELDGPGQLAARRSALTLKAMTHTPTGAIVAAPTSSLPEVPGGPRNWDYRFAWIRDSSFSSRACAEVGCEAEEDAFRAFVMRSAAGHAGDLQVVYGVGGERRLGVTELSGLQGYHASTPVRVGNGASGQRQLDAYGELVNLTWRWHRRGHSPSDDQWRFLVSLIDHAAGQWRNPDQGIWEWAGPPEHFVHSKVLCWAALDRGIRLAEECMRSAPIRRWERARDQCRRAIERRGFDRRRGCYVQAFDRKDMDAALLLLPTVEFVDWKDERMVATVAAIREDLDAGGGLLYRYRRRDGLRGREGAFLCCSFWLVECLAYQDELAEAEAVLQRALATGSDLGLFSEEVDPNTGVLLGNFPQGLTHLAHISATVALAQAQQRLQCGGLTSLGHVLDALCLQLAHLLAHSARTNYSAVANATLRRCFANCARAALASKPSDHSRDISLPDAAGRPHPGAVASAPLTLAGPPRAPLAHSIALLQSLRPSQLAPSSAQSRPLRLLSLDLADRRYFQARHRSDPPTCGLQWPHRPVDP